jgi:hypothetical protein
MSVRRHLQGATTAGAWAVAALCLAACGESVPPVIGHPTLIIVNQNENKPLLKIYVHDRIDNYGASPNLLSSPLPVGAQLVVSEPTIKPGAWFVTVTRKKVDLGEPVAVTTGEPLDLRDGIYTLWVFDESFRLWKPVKADLGARDRPLEARRELSTTDAARDHAPADAGPADRRGELSQ